MSAPALTARTASSGRSGGGTKGARDRDMFRLLGGVRALWILILFSCLRLDAGANGVRVRDDRTQVTISANAPITAAWLYADVVYPPNVTGPASLEIPLSTDYGVVSSGTTPLGQISWSGSTLTIRKNLVANTGQYVLPLRGAIASSLQLPQTAARFVFGCKITTAGKTVTCPLLSYQPPRFCVYMHYVEGNTIRPLVSGSSLWRTDVANRTTPKPIINAQIRTGTYAAALVVSGNADDVRKMITSYTGRTNPALPPSVEDGAKTYFNTRGLVHRGTRTNVLTPAQFQYSGFDYAVKQTFGTATNSQWTYVKGMALYDGVTVVSIADYEKFDTSFMKSPPGYPGVYTTWGLPVPFPLTTLAFEASIPDSFLVKSGLVTYSVANAYTE